MNLIIPQSNRVSDYFQLGKSQVELDFIDVPIDTDIQLFCDPFAFVIEKDPWFQECSALVYDFFSRLVDCIRNDEEVEAKRMLGHIGEANEAHLGFSSGQPAGLGIGPEKATQLYNRMKQSKAVKTGKLYDLADCDLFIPGIGPDNISDMTINIIREKLLEYTALQCTQLGIPTSNVQGGYRWEPDLQRWTNGYAQLPVANGKRLLLLPKAAVRYHLSLEHTEYYEHYVLNYLQAEHLEAGSSLVELLKNGKKRVTKKNLKEDYPLDKDFLFEFSDKHPEVLDHYKEQARKKSSALTDELIEEVQRNSKEVDIDDLINRLRSTPAGMAAAGQFHKTIMGILEAVFYPQLRNFVIEQDINEGRKRIDIVANNAQSDAFFGDLNTLHHIFCPYVFIECKNYSRKIGNPELDQLIGRFSKKKGRFGILVCRNVADKSRLLNSCRDVVNDDQGLIIVLEDEDIVKMLEFRKTRDYKGISDYLHAKLREILL